MIFFYIKKYDKTKSQRINMMKYQKIKKIIQNQKITSIRNLITRVIYI